MKLKKYSYLIFCALFALTLGACTKDDKKSDSVEPVVMNIRCGGTEIKNNQVIKYVAEKDIFGEYIAGDKNEPTFKASSPCNVEVVLSIPKNTLKSFEWCGITNHCDNLQVGTHSRKKENMNSKLVMGLQAHFNKGESATCKVKVEVKVDGKLDRTFFMEYSYEASEEDITPNNPDTPTYEYAEPAKKSPIVVIAFTGQRCRYCPNQGRDLQKKQTKYGKENYIIAALHIYKEFSLLPKQHVSLYNQEAIKYADRINIHSGLPHRVYNTLGSYTDDTELVDMFKPKDLLECKGNVTFKDREYNISLKTRLRSDCKDDVKGKDVDILFWALENDIEALQDDNGKWTYPKHQHIFRGSLNGTWGEDYKIGSEYTKTLAVPSSVSVIENTDVIAFFLDREKGEILDAASFTVEKS